MTPKNGTSEDKRGTVVCMITKSVILIYLLFSNFMLGIGLNN